MEIPCDLALVAQVLERTPVAVGGLLHGLSDEWIFSDEGTNTWSPFEILGHLINAERADWIPRTKIILEFGTARPFDPFDRYAHLRESRDKPLGELLDTFETLRQESLHSLVAMQLKPADLERKGSHPEFGEVTLRQLLATWVVHDLSHIAQMAEVMARQYKRAVGPWSAYLPIVQP